MGKALKTVGAIVGGAVLIATGVGALAGVNIAAMGISTLTGSLTVGQLGTLASGVAAVGGALDKPKSTGSGNPGDWTSNPDQPTPFLFGRMGVAGKIVHRDEFGPDDNMYQGVVGILSGAGPIKGVLGFKGDDQAVTFDGNGKATTSQWKDEMWMRYRLGAQPDTALTSPPGLKNGATLPSWGASHRLSGKACYLQVMGENSKRTAYPNGEPVPQHLCEGIYGWDGRYDDTWPGGIGPCRFGVRSTYRYITDPIIAGLNWALGLVENGKVVGGIGASQEGVDIDSFLQAANVSEANGWIVAAWPDTSEDVSQVLNQFLQAGGASRARHSGRISCVTRGAVLPSVVNVTAADLAGPIELDTGATLFNRLNTITPKFMSEAAGWQPVAGTPVTFPDFVEEDGGEKGDQFDYRFVPAAKQAAELAALDILDAREPFSGTVPLKPHMRRLKPGSRFTFTAPGLLLDGVKCMVLGRSYTAQTGEARISFRSETDGKIDLALGKTTALPSFPNLTPPNPLLVTAPLPNDWTIVVRPPTTGGQQVPGFDLTGGVSNETATAVLVEYVEVLDPEAPFDDNAVDWRQAYSGPPVATTIPIDGVQPGAFYYISVRYQRGQNYSDREVYGPYQAPILVAGDVVPTAPALQAIRDALDNLPDLDEVRDELDEVRDEVDETRDLLDVQAQATLEDILAGVGETRRRIAATTIDGRPIGTIIVEEQEKTENTVNTLRLIGAASEDGTAFILDRDTVRVSETMSFAQRDSQIAAQFAGTATSYLRTTAEAAAEDGAASIRTLEQMGAEIDEGGSFTLSESRITVNGGGTQATRNSLTESRFGGTASSFLLTTAQTAASNASASVNTLQQMGVTLNNGAAWQLDASRVSVAPGEVLASRLTSIGGQINDRLTQTQVDARYDSKLAISLGPMGAITQKIDTQMSAFRDANGLINEAQAIDIIDTQAGPGGSLGQRLIAVESTAGEAESTAGLLLQAINGEGALAGLFTRVNGKITGITIDGQSQVIDILANAFRVSAPDGSNSTQIFDLTALGMALRVPILIDWSGVRLIIGGGSNWLFWFGPQTIGPTAATRTNGYLAMGTDGEIYKGNQTLDDIYGGGGGAAFQASVEPPNRDVFVPNGQGNYNMGTFTVTPTDATGSVSYQWSRVFGSPIFSANAPTSATTAITATGAQVGQVYQAIFEWRATDAGTGQVRRGNAYVTLTTESGS